MPFVGDTLFNQTDVSGFERHITSQIDHELDLVSEQDIRNKSPDEIASHILKDIPNFLVVDFENGQKVIESTKVPKPRDLYFGSDSTGYADGIRHAVKFKFTGWPQFFNIKPSTSGSQSSHGIVSADTIIVGIEFHPSQQEYVEQYINDQKNALKWNVDNLNHDLNNAVIRIKDLIKNKVLRRASHLKGVDKARGDL